jgi:chemotaxis protein MotB
MRKSQAQSLLLCAVVMIGCGGRNWPAEQEALQNQLREAQQSLQTATTRIEELEQQNGQMRALLEAQGRDMSDLTGTRNRLEEELNAARTREQQNQQRLAALRNMAAQFRDMIRAGQLRVRIVRGSMVVELPANVLFDSGSAELREDGQAALERVAQVLASVQNRDFLVAGHTDNVPLGRRGRFASNWDLSAARGVSVVRFLTEHGMPPEHVAAAGYAETRPVASNSAEEGRAQNRRIEIIVMPNLDELPDLSGLEGELGGS